MELLDVVDENNKLINKIEDKDIIHENGLWHREVAIWIVNEKNEILIQKRAATKKIKPNKWGITAGHIDAGEEPINAAIRETFEEIGLKVNKNDLKFLFISKIFEQPNNKINNHFTYHYTVNTNTKIEEFIIQKEELSEVKYISYEQFEKIIREKDEDYTFTKQTYMEQIILALKENIK